MEKLKVDCPSCKKQWDINKADWQNLNGCPFCLTPIKLPAEEIVVDSFGRAIYKVFIEAGIETLNQKGRFLSLMMDYAPQYKKEIRMVNKSCSQELLSQIAAWASPEVLISLEKTRVRVILLEEEGLSESWADQICDAFSGAFEAVRGKADEKSAISESDTRVTSACLPTVTTAKTESVASVVEDTATTIKTSNDPPKERSFEISSGSGALSDRLEAAYQAAKGQPPSKSTPQEDFVICGNALLKYMGSSPAVYIPNGISTIEKWAFQNNKSLVSIVLPDTLREIKDCAFYACQSLMTVQFPKGLEKIGSFSFKECPCLKNVTIPQNVKLLDNVFDSTVAVSKS